MEREVGEEGVLLTPGSQPQLLQALLPRQLPPGMPAEENLDPMRMCPVVFDQRERGGLRSAWKPGGWEFESLFSDLMLLF